jgi:hypothetical protein
MSSVIPKRRGGLRLTFVLDSPEQLDLLRSDSLLFPPDSHANFFQNRSAQRDSGSTGDEQKRVVTSKVSRLRSETTIRTVEEDRGRAMGGRCEVEETGTETFRRIDAEKEDESIGRSLR